MARPCKARATVICRQDDRVLLVRKAEAKWTLPGGKIEIDEGPGEAARRELAEETGLASDALEFLAYHQFDRRAHYVFRVTVRDALAARPQNEIAACGWFSLRELCEATVKRPSMKLLELYGLADVRDLDPTAGS